jgi:hypothetical protein
MSMVGADADRLDAAAVQMRKAADSLDAHSSSLGRLLGGLSWLGQVASAFANMWNSHHRPQLGSTANSIRDAADKLTAQAKQQRDASMSGGIGDGFGIMPYRLDPVGPSDGWTLAPGFTLPPGFLDWPPTDPGFVLPNLEIPDLWPSWDFGDDGGQDLFEWMKGKYEDLSLIKGFQEFGAAGKIGPLSVIMAGMDTLLWAKDGMDSGFWDGKTMIEGVSAVASWVGVAGLAVGAAPVAIGAVAFGAVFSATNAVLDNFHIGDQTYGEIVSGATFDAVYGDTDMTPASADALVQRLDGPMGIFNYVNDVGSAVVDGATDLISDAWDSIFD